MKKIRNPLNNLKNSKVVGNTQNQITLTPMYKLLKTGINNLLKNFHNGWRNKSNMYPPIREEGSQERNNLAIIAINSSNSHSNMDKKGISKMFISRRCRMQILSSIIHIIKSTKTIITTFNNHILNTNPPYHRNQQIQKNTEPINLPPLSTTTLYPT